MRSKLLLLVFIPTLVFGQRFMSKQEQQEYVNRVSDFCSLLTRWCKGERTLDSKIYNLCSGRDFSVYDDITAKKETTMRNYLLGIQRNYPTSFSMEISKPSTNNMVAYNDGEVGIAIKYDFVGIDRAIGYQISPWPKDIKLLAFRVNQTTSLGSSTKYILYDVNINKITGLISGEGTQSSFLDGIYLAAKKDYRNAINKFLYAANNKRASYRKISTTYASALYAMIGDYSSAIELAEKNGLKYYLSFYKAERSFSQKRYQEAVSHFKTCESIESASQKKEFNSLETNDSLNFIVENRIPYLHYCIGLSYILDGKSQLGLSFLEKAANEGFLEAAYCIYKYGIQTNIISRSYLPYNKAINWLFYAARKGLDLAQFEYGVYKEYVEKKKKEAIYWYYESIKNSIYHPLSKACLGKLCVQTKNGLPYLGYSYLYNSLEEELFNQLNDMIIGFQPYLDGYKDRLSILTDGQFWIKSKSDVKMLLNKYSSYAPSKDPAMNDSVAADYIYHESDENYSRMVGESGQIFRWYRKFKKENPDKVATYY